MFGVLAHLSKPVLRVMSPEGAHEATLIALELGLYPRPMEKDEPALQSKVFGLDLPNPIAIAAGFDKDARVAQAVLNMGCGFCEVGTLTPKPQKGNPKPRVFRLWQDRGVINRLGFNNGGHEAAYKRLQKHKGKGVVGINIGANKDSSDRSGDYVSGLKTFYDLASYFTVNISSPNTPGLRDLQAPGALDELLGRLMEARGELVAQGAPSIPIIIKISPDIAEDDIAPIVGRLVAHKVDGIAVSNTTLSRPDLTSDSSHEAGGLSGRPLFHRSTVMLARVYMETGGRIPLIGIGGVDRGERAVEKIKAGATLIQLYTGLIYEGVGLISRIKSDLSKECLARGVANYQELIGVKAQEWSSKSLEG